MRLLFVSFVVLLLCHQHAAAQQQAIDSLQRELQKNGTDSLRALTLMRIAVNYESLDTAKAAAYYQQALEFALSHKLTHQTGVIYQNRTYLQMSAGHYADARKSLDSAYSFIIKSKQANALFVKAQILATYSTLYRYTNDLKESVRSQLLALEIYEQLGKTVNIVNGYSNLSSIYHDMADYDNQEKAIRKALKYELDAGETKDLFKCYSVLMFAITMHGKYNEAKTILDSAQKYYNANDDYNVVISFHLAAGLLQMNLKNLPAARQHFEQSSTVAKQHNQLFSIIQSKMQLGRVLTLEKNWKEAEPLLLEAYQESTATGEINQRTNALENLFRFYEESGNYKTAIKYLKDYQNLLDSIATRDNNEYIAGLEVKYQTKQSANRIGQLEAEKKVQQLRLRQKNILNAILIGGAVIILIISLLLYRNYRHKQRLQQQRISELETEKQLAATEAVLKGEEIERTRLAKDLHDGLGGMLSGIKYSLNTMKGNMIMTPENAQAFERSIDMLDSSIQEMRRVAHNMMPEALVRFGLDAALQDFCNDINQTGALKINYQSIGLKEAVVEQTTAITIYRIVQELINNTMKHAAAKSAIVQVTKTDGHLSVTVEDDGKGFDTAILQRGKGIGWSNIQHRVEFLKGKMDVAAAPGKGTSVFIEISA